MWVFYVLMFLPIVIHYIELPGYEMDLKKKNKVAITLFFIMLTVLIMLRHEVVGNDTHNYITFFKIYSKLDWKYLESENLEIGYLYFNKIVSYISTEPQVFLAIAALVASALLYPTYRRLCVDSTLTIALFCSMSTFVMMFSGIRQMLAIAIGIVAYEFTRMKKPILFVLAVALAMTMHTSAFILVLMYPVYHVKITKVGLMVVVPMLGILFALNKPIFSFLSTYIEEYTRFEADITETGAYTMLLLFVAFTIFSFAIPNEKEMDKETYGLRNLLILAFALQMFAPLHSLAMRMNYYYIILVPLTMPKLIANTTKRWWQLAAAAKAIMVVFFITYFFANANDASGNLNVFPYHFYWEDILL